MKSPLSSVAVVLVSLLALAPGCSERLTGPAGGPPEVTPPPAPPVPRPEPAAGTAHIYLANADGSDITRIAQGSSPAWSPDGKNIAFGREATGDLYVMAADGSQVARPRAQDFPGGTPYSEGRGYPTWSRDGLKLAFSQGGTYYGDVWVMSVADDGHSVQLAASAVSPAWSPDGKKIAFVRLSGDDGYNAIHMVNADGSGDTALTQPAGGASRPTWSPDGKRIAFGDCLEGQCRLYVLNVESGVKQQITSLRGVWTSAWSPDGSTIAVAAEGGIWIVSADGADAALLIANAGQPAWSPDGKKIAFMRRGGE